MIKILKNPIFIQDIGIWNENQLMRNNGRHEAKRWKSYNWYVNDICCDSNKKMVTKVTEFVVACIKCTTIQRIQLGMVVRIKPKWQLERS